MRNGHEIRRYIHTCTGMKNTCTAVYNIPSRYIFLHEGRHVHMHIQNPKQTKSNLLPKVKGIYFFVHVPTKDI